MLDTSLRPGMPRSVVSAGDARRWVRGHTLALGVGTLIAVVVVALRTAGLLHGGLALALGVVLTLAVPTSRLLSRRILLAGAFFLGAVPALWWWSLPVGDVGRATLLLAVIAGALTGSVLWHGRAEVGRRARLLLPRWHVVDLIPLAAAAATAWVTLAWLRVSSGAAALAALLPGWDNSAHYGMVAMLRRHGVTIDQLGAAPGAEHWKFVEYPQGHHATVATLMEVLTSPETAAADVELVAYVRAGALTLVIAATVLAAGLAALPRLRRRPEIAVPVTVFAVAAFVVGPGGHAFSSGFANFVVAAALAAGIPLLVVTMPRIPMPLHLAAVGSLLVGVAHTWALLLVVAVPAAAVVLLPWGAGRLRAGRTAWVLSATVAVATVLGLLHAAGILSVLDAGQVLVIPGGIVAPDLGVLLAVVLAALGVCLWGAGRRASMRVTWTAVVPAAGLVAAAGLAIIQLRGGGELSYYFWKLMVGVELVSAVVLVIGISRMVPATRSPRPALARAVGTAGILALTAAATQVFGFVSTGRGLFVAPGDNASSELLISAAAVAEASPTARLTVLDDPGGGALHPINAQQWLLALTGRWTVEANDAAGTLVGEAGSLLASEAVARLVLARDAESWVIASPQQAAVLRSQLGADPIAERIVSW